MSQFNITRIESRTLPQTLERGDFRELPLQEGKTDFYRTHRFDPIYLEVRLAFEPRSPRHAVLSLTNFSMHGNCPSDIERDDAPRISFYADKGPIPRSVAAVYEGDANHDGRKDYLVTLSNGVSFLFTRNEEPFAC